MAEERMQEVRAHEASAVSQVMVVNQEQSIGSFQHLPNGNKFFCWAYHTSISEHTSDGSVIMEARFDKFLTTYRASKHPWVGAPTVPPDVHTEALYLGPSAESDVLTVIHVSWNGDTRTTRWQFDGIDTAGREHRLGTAERYGFETKFEYKGLARQVVALALDKDGNRLGRSEVVVTVAPKQREQEGSDVRLKYPKVLQEEEPAPEEDEDEDEMQDEEKEDDRPSFAVAVPMPEFTSWNSFAVGLACGMLLGSLIWLSWRSCQSRRLWRVLNRRKTVHYMPLEEQTD